jgi:hypothetical protein
MVNPRFKLYKALGLSLTQVAEIKTAVGAYMDANDNKQELDPAAVRALHPKLADERVWNSLLELMTS